jgi:hypothetical protein
MAKDKELGTGELFRKTEPEETKPWPADNSDINEGRIWANGVGLRTGEIAALDAIGKKYDLARNALIRYAVRKLILDWRAGLIDLSVDTEAKPTVRRPLRRLKMP